jgi:hypothetical protein
MTKQLSNLNHISLKLSLFLLKAPNRMSHSKKKKSTKGIVTKLEANVRIQKIRRFVVVCVHSNIHGIQANDGQRERGKPLASGDRLGHAFCVVEVLNIVHELVQFVICISFPLEHGVRRMVVEAGFPISQISFHHGSLI